MAAPVITYCYLDTSALCRRAEAKIANPTARNQKIATVLEPLFKDPDRQFACSETTLLEFHNNITKQLRAGGDFDFSWWTTCREMLFRDIASGRIFVLPTPPRATEHVMSLVTLFTLDHNRALEAWDAMHVVIAARWAYDLDTQVELITSDAHFAAPTLVAELGRRLRVVNLDIAAGTGEGADSGR